MNTHHFLDTISPPLQDFIYNFWQVDAVRPSKNETIVPKGIVEIIFNFSEGQQIDTQLQGNEFRLPRCFINGFNTSPIIQQLPERQNFFGVRLQPFAVKKMLGIPAGEFSNDVVDISLLDQSIGLVWEEMAAGNFPKRIAIFEQWVSKKIHQLPAQELLMNRFLCGTANHEYSVKELAALMCYSPRHLARKLCEVTSMNTEEVLLYKKYLHSLHLVHHAKMSLTEVAYLSGFTDQPHFIKTFKTFTQLTPGEYRRLKGTIPGHIMENVR